MGSLSGGSVFHVLIYITLFLSLSLAYASLANRYNDRVYCAMNCNHECELIIVPH